MKRSEGRDLSDHPDAAQRAPWLGSCFWCERIHPIEHPLSVCPACAARLRTMRSLEMSGSYPLSDEAIDAAMTRTSPGNYALGYMDGDTFSVFYVGRSDSDVRRRLHEWVGMPSPSGHHASGAQASWGVHRRGPLPVDAPALGRVGCCESSYTRFAYSYARSADEAYAKEWRNYDTFGGDRGLDNESEPVSGVSTSIEERNGEPPMKISPLRRTACLRFPMLLLALALWPGVAATQEASSGTLPLNAHARRYGGGWECDRGFEKVDGSCVAVAVPANAHLDSFGSRWECDRGYRKANQGCERIEVPPHAYLAGSSRSGWECERGYRKIDPSCVAVAVPENAYLASSGDRWECERGFAASGDTCVRLALPPEGYIGRSGNEWECNRGYRRRDGSCVAVAVPSNGFLDSSGSDWSCERGFRKELDACVAIQVPVNAHLAYSGNRWTCDTGYRPYGEACTEEKR